MQRACKAPQGLPAPGVAPSLQNDGCHGADGGPPPQCTARGACGGWAEEEVHEENDAPGTEATSSRDAAGVLKGPGPPWVEPGTIGHVAAAVPCLPSSWGRRLPMTTAPLPGCSRVRWQRRGRRKRSSCLRRRWPRLKVVCCRSSRSSVTTRAGPRLLRLGPQCTGTRPGSGSC